MHNLNFQQTKWTTKAYDKAQKLDFCMFAHSSLALEKLLVLLEQDMVEIIPRKHNAKKKKKTSFT